MSTVSTPVSDPVIEEVVLDEAAEDAAFGSGYSGEPTPTPTESTPPVAETPPTTPETPPAPEPVVITKEDWSKIQAEAASIADLRQDITKRFDTTFGKMGGLERTLTQLQQNTPVGQPIVVTEDDLQELKNEGFPDLTSSLAKGLTRILSKFKGTGPVTIPEPIDVKAQVEPFIQERLQAAKAEWRQETAIERLTDLHPNWRDIAGPEGSQTEYRQWLATQPDGAKVLESDNPREVARSLTAFLEQKKAAETPKPPAKPATRSQRLAEAVPAKGGSGAPPGQTLPSEEEQFEVGFKTGR